METQKKKLSDILIEAYLNKLSLGDLPLVEELFWESIAENGPFVYPYNPKHHVIFSNKILKQVYKIHTAIIESNDDIAQIKNNNILNDQIGGHILYIAFIDTLWNQEYSLALFLLYFKHPKQYPGDLSFISQLVHFLDQNEKNFVDNELPSGFFEFHPQFQKHLSLFIFLIGSEKVEPFMRQWAENFKKYSLELMSSN